MTTIRGHKVSHTQGSEIKKTRPCIVVSPNEMNWLNTVIIAPLTSKGFDLDFCPKIKFQEKEGLVLLDQIRSVDKTRLIKKVGSVSKAKGGD